MIYNEYNSMRQLKIPETGINFSIFLFLHYYDIVFFTDFNDYITNCNMLLLKKYDNTKTMGKVTFIPIHFLYYYYNSNKKKEYDKDMDINTIDTIDNKKYLFNFLLNDLKEKNIFVYDFLKDNTYKGIQLFFFRKPYAKFDFSINKDFSLIKEINDDINSYKNGFVNPALQLNIDPNIRTSEWMSSADISNIIYTLTKIYDDVYYIDLINFPVTHTDVALVSSGFESFFSPELENEFINFKNSKKRFLTFVMLYNSHFTCLIYDSKIKLEKNINPGVCYMFNSGGYDPSKLKLCTDILFIDANMKIKKFSRSSYNGFSRTSHINYNNIDVIIKLIKKKFKCETFILNCFTIQNYYSECGMFCTLFLYLFIINSNCKNKNLSFIKKLYFTMSFFGDLLVGYMRGLFFVNKEDCEEAKYKNTLSVFKLQNKKIREFKEIYLKNIDRIIETANYYSNIKKNIEI